MPLTIEVGGIFDVGGDFIQDFKEKQPLKEGIREKSKSVHRELIKNQTIQSQSGPESRFRLPPELWNPKKMSWKTQQVQLT